MGAETFKLFDSLKLDAPITTADIPALLIKLEEKKVGFEVKVKEWEENKEEMKRKIKEGIITADDLVAKPEEVEEAKEETTEEVNEVENEEEKEEEEKEEEKEEEEKEEEKEEEDKEEEAKEE